MAESRGLDPQALRPTLVSTEVRATPGLLSILPEQELAESGGPDPQAFRLQPVSGRCPSLTGSLSKNGVTAGDQTRVARATTLRSAIELRSHSCPSRASWRQEMELNHRRVALQATALPLSYPGNFGEIPENMGIGGTPPPIPIKPRRSGILSIPRGSAAAAGKSRRGPTHPYLATKDATATAFLPVPASWRPCGSCRRHSC